MTYPREIILKAVHLYVEGLSLSKIGDLMWQHHGYKVCESRILDWVREYSNPPKRFERGLKPTVKDRVHIEVQLKLESGIAVASMPLTAPPNSI